MQFVTETTVEGEVAAGESKSIIMDLHEVVACCAKSWRGGLGRALPWGEQNMCLHKQVSMLVIEAEQRTSAHIASHHSFLTAQPLAGKVPAVGGIA